MALNAEEEEEKKSKKGRNCALSNEWERIKIKKN